MKLLTLETARQNVQENLNRVHSVAGIVRSGSGYATFYGLQSYRYQLRRPANLVEVYQWTVSGIQLCPPSLLMDKK